MVRVWKLGSWPGIGKYSKKSKSRYVEVALRKGFVAIGYAWLGNLTGKTINDFQDAGEHLITAKQLYAFANEILEDDIILLYDNRLEPHVVYVGQVRPAPAELAPHPGSSYYFVPRGHRLDYFPGRSSAPNRLNVRWLVLSGKRSFRAELPWQDTLHEVVASYLETKKGMFEWIRDPVLKSFLKRKFSEPKPSTPQKGETGSAHRGSSSRPRWVFQAREFVEGKKYYPLYERIPRILERVASKRIVHWSSVEHRRTPFVMKEGDMGLLFQGATRTAEKRGFYGTAVITNLNGKCTAPKGEVGSHHGRNNHGRAVGIDLKYLSRFRAPLLPRVSPGNSLGNKNLQKLIAGGKGGSAQDSVFGIADEDWALISSAFPSDAEPSADGRKDARRIRNNTKGGRGWSQIDPQRKAKIEKAAIDLTRDTFESEGYMVNSVEKDNLGWDLDATKNGVELHLEVKGLSGSDIGIELTPNEYRHVKRKSSAYRICVVTEALGKPILHVFSFSELSRHWEDELGVLLKAREMVAARMALA